VVPGFLAEARSRTKRATHELYAGHLAKLTAKFGTRPLSHLTAPVLACGCTGSG
jgi:hypothetical protein